MQNITNENIFAKKIGEALAEYYSKYMSAKKKGTTDLLDQKLSDQLEEAIRGYQLSKERHGK